MTAHPKICPETGELLFFGYQMMSEPYLTYYRADAKGALVQTEQIDLGRGIMMHDFNVTRNHVIFMDLPIVFGEIGPQYKPETGARLGVMPRNGTNADVRWFEIAPCTVFHPLNAWEDGSKIVIDVCKQEHGQMRGGQEPSFAPKHADAPEGEGFVLVYAYDEAEDASSLVILDAENMGAAPLAKVKLPQRVPYGAHGN